MYRAVAGEKPGKEGRNYIRMSVFSSFGCRWGDIDDFLMILNGVHVAPSRIHGLNANNYQSVISTDKQK